MFRNSRRLLVLLIITVFAFILRIYDVGNNPPSASWDEISIGWNAYSVLKTGKDEHQRFLPLDKFTAFGDYKPPFPVYATVPFIALFGRTETAVRIPSVIFGTLTVPLSYLLVKELLKRYRRDKKTIRSQIELNSEKYLPLLTAGLLAISPWHLLLSRAGFEANIALFFIVTGVYVILSARQFPKLYIFAWIPFVFAVYTFNSSRYFTPILGFILCVYGFGFIRKNIRLFTTGIVIAVILLIPIIPHLVSAESRLRYEEVNIFNDYPLILKSNNRIAQDDFSLWGRLFHNYRLVYARSFLIHYFDNLQPWFLFIKGDGNPKFSIQDTGQLYLIEAPLLIYGIYNILVFRKREAVLLLLWMLGSIIPAAVARETPHALRIENSLPVWQIFAGYGIISFVDKIRRSGKAIVAGLITMAYLFSFGYFAHNYLYHYPNEFSGEWQYGYKQAISYTESNKNSYDSVVISDIIGRPYIYTLFYGKYEPDYFWKTVKGGFDSAGFYNVGSFGKYYFTRTGIGSYPGKTVYVLPPYLVPENANILKVIDLLNGTPVLVIFEP